MGKTIQKEQLCLKPYFSLIAFSKRNPFFILETLGFYNGDEGVQSSLFPFVFKPLDYSWFTSKISLLEVAASMTVCMVFRIGQTVYHKRVCRHLAKDQGHSKPD